MNTKLGHRQRRLLLDIAHYGQGSWPTGWLLRGTEAETLASLARRQLVDSAGVSARLTSAGHLVVAGLKGTL